MGGNNFETLSQKLPVLDQPHKIYPAQLFQTFDPWKMFVCIPTASEDKSIRAQELQTKTLSFDLVHCFRTTIYS